DPCHCCSATHHTRTRATSIHPTPTPLNSPPLPYTTLFRSRLYPPDREFGPEDHGADHDRWLGRAARADHLEAGEGGLRDPQVARSEEHTSELQSREKLVCRRVLEAKKERQRPPVPQARDRT